MEDLINQLPPSIVLLGDFNAHSTEWGCSKNDSKGKMISDLMLQCNLSLLNDGSATYLHPGSGSQSAIDLSICDPLLYLDLSWKVHEDLCGSDHFPIIIYSDRAMPSVTNSTWKLSKADWDTFSDKAASDLKADCIINAADPVANFTDALCTITNITIPKSKSKPVKRLPNHYVCMYVCMYVSFGQGSSLLWTHTLRPLYSRPIALTQEGRSQVDVCECMRD